MLTLYSELLKVLIEREIYCILSPNPAIYGDEQLTL